MFLLGLPKVQARARSDNTGRVIYRELLDRTLEPSYMLQQETTLCYLILVVADDRIGTHLVNPISTNQAANYLAYEIQFVRTLFYREDF